MARPKKDIDETQVEKLASIGCTNVEIAAFFDTSESTIRRRFSEIITKGKERGKIRLRKKQMELALRGNVQMLIWLGKQVLGQREPKQEHDFTNPIDITISYAKSNKSQSSSKS